MLGVFLGPGNLEEDDWRPRITTVEKALNSWRQHSLSYKGKALVINAFALSRVWYVASLIHVPRWVSVELNTLSFKFFSSGNRDLVACRVVVQPPCLGFFFLSLIFSARLWLFMFSGFVVLFLLHLHGSLSWYFGFHPGLPLLRMSFFLLRFVFLRILCLYSIVLC